MTSSAPWTPLRNMMSSSWILTVWWQYFFYSKQKKPKKECKRPFRGFRMIWISEIHARGCLSFSACEVSCRVQAKESRPILGHPLMADTLEFTPRPKEEIKYGFAERSTAFGSVNDAHRLQSPVFKPYWFPRSPLTEIQRDWFMKVMLSYRKVSLCSSPEHLSNFPHNNSLKRWYPVLMHVVKHGSSTFF